MVRGRGSQSPCPPRAPEHPPAAVSGDEMAALISLPKPPQDGASSPSSVTPHAELRLPRAALPQPSILAPPLPTNRHKNPEAIQLHWPGFLSLDSACESDVYLSFLLLSPVQENPSEDKSPLF